MLKLAPNTEFIQDAIRDSRTADQPRVALVDAIADHIADRIGRDTGWAVDRSLIRQELYRELSRCDGMDDFVERADETINWYCSMASVISEQLKPLCDE